MARSQVILAAEVGTLRVRIVDKAISTLQSEHEASTSTASSYFQGKLHSYSHFCVVHQELEIDMANRLDIIYGLPAASPKSRLRRL